MVSFGGGGRGGKLKVKAYVNRINVIQNISGMWKRISCRQTFRNLNILPVHSIHTIKVACYIQNNLEQNVKVHSHNTENIGSQCSSAQHRRFSKKKNILQ